MYSRLFTRPSSLPPRQRFHTSAVFQKIDATKDTLADKTEPLRNVNKDTLEGPKGHSSFTDTTIEQKLASDDYKNNAEQIKDEFESFEDGGYNAANWKDLDPNKGKPFKEDSPNPKANYY